MTQGFADSHALSDPSEIDKTINLIESPSHSREAKIPAALFSEAERSTVRHGALAAFSSIIAAPRTQQ